MRRKNLPHKRKFVSLVRKGMKAHKKIGGHNGRPPKYMTITSEGILHIRPDIRHAALKYWALSPVYRPMEKQDMIRVIFPADIGNDMTTRDASRLADNVIKYFPSKSKEFRGWVEQRDNLLAMPPLSVIQADAERMCKEFVEKLPPKEQRAWHKEERDRRREARLQR